MASIDYSDVFDLFCGMVTDSQFFALPENTANEMMMTWLKLGCSKVYMKKIFTSFQLDDDMESISYKLANESDDDNFVKILIAKSMVVEWLEPKVNSTLFINQFFGGKEQKFFSQSSHAQENRKLLKETKIEIRKLVRDHTYVYNTYLEGF